MRRWWIAVALAGCSGQPTARIADGGAQPLDLGPAPTYTQLYDAFFAVGTPGHCATVGCHTPPKNHIWICGTTKESCYQGMVKVRLIDPAHPSASLIVDPQNSPLAWFNPNGPMPFDNPVPNPEGAGAIASWVAAGALDN